MFVFKKTWYGIRNNWSISLVFFYLISSDTSPLGGIFSFESWDFIFLEGNIKFLLNIPYIMNVVTWWWANIHTSNIEISCFIDLYFRLFQYVTVSSSPYTSDISSDNLLTCLRLEMMCYLLLLFICVYCSKIWLVL